MVLEEIADRHLRPREPPADCPFLSAADPEIIEPILKALEAEAATRQLATEIAAAAESTMWIVGKRRSTVAATAVYVAGVIEDASDPSFKQNEVARAASISSASISTYWEELQLLFEHISGSPQEG